MDKDKAHILVVDDDTRLRSLLQRFLRENGFYVSTAKDAAEARERLTEYKFDGLRIFSSARRRFARRFGTSLIWDSACTI